MFSRQDLFVSQYLIAFQCQSENSSLKLINFTIILKISVSADDQLLFFKKGVWGKK